MNVKSTIKREAARALLRAIIDTRETIPNTLLNRSMGFRLKVAAEYARMSLDLVTELSVLNGTEVPVDWKVRRYSDGET